MARLVAYQLLLDQALDGFLANIDVLEHGLRIGAVNLLHRRAQLVGFEIDLIAKYLLAVDGRNAMDVAEHSTAESPERHGKHEESEGDLHLPRILVTPNSF